MIGGFIGKPIGGVIQFGTDYPQAVTANVDCAGTVSRAVGKLQTATVDCAATITNRAITFTRTALCDVSATVTRAVTTTLAAAHVTAAAVALKNGGKVLAAVTVTVFASLVRLALNITSRRVLQDPIDCILAGDQHYKESGREFEIRPMNTTEKLGGSRTPLRRLKGGKPSFTVTTGKRGYD